MEGRKNYIDVIKGIGIILVILGHIECEAIIGWKQFVASFHMPLFFFISGILFKESNISREHIMGFLESRALRLLIPYYVWGLIYMDGINIEQLLRLIWGNNKLYGAAGLWFLPTMLVALCVCSLLLKIYKKKNAYGWLVILAFCGIAWGLDIISDKTIIRKVGFPFSFDIGLLAGVFVFLGWIYNNELKLFPHKKVQQIALGVLCLIITCILSIVNHSFINDDSFDRVVMARGSYGLFPLFVIGAIIGSLGIVLIGRCIDKSSLLEFVGRNSLVFMVTNHLSIKLIDEVFSYLKINIETWNKMVIIIIYLSGALIICSLISALVKRFIPILGGVKNDSKN